MGGWTEFWRRNKRWFQVILGFLAIYGIDRWDIFWRLFRDVFADRLFYGAWWTAPILIAPVESPWAHAAARTSLFLLTAGFCVNGYFAYKHRRSPLTSLNTEARLKFTDGGKHCTTHRIQRFRANRPGVRAYYGSVMVDREGAAIPRERIRATLEPNPAYQNSVDLKLFGSQRRWELVCEFENDLPYKWYLPFIPSFLLRGDPKSKPKLLKQFITEQRIQSVSLHEYGGAENRYQVSASRYTLQSVSITLDFSGDSWKPGSSQISAIRLQTSAAFKVTPVEDPPHVYRIELDSLQPEEVLIVTWDGPEGRDAELKRAGLRELARQL